MLVAAIVSPRRASRADARLQCHRAVIAGAAGNVTPDDAVAALDRITENVGALAGDVFNNAAGLVPRDNRQGIAIAQGAVPAVHVGAAQRRGGDFYQEGTRIELGNLHLLDGQRFVVFGDDGGATGVHDESFHSSRRSMFSLTTETIENGTPGTVPIVSDVPIVSTVV